jgi:hypothetical protein
MVVAIRRNAWSERLVVINWNDWSSSAGARRQTIDRFLYEQACDCR